MVSIHLSSTVAPPGTGCPSDPPRSLTHSLPPTWDPQRPQLVRPGCPLWPTAAPWRTMPFYLTHYSVYSADLQLAWLSWKATLVLRCGLFREESLVQGTNHHVLLGEDLWVCLLQQMA